MGDRSFDDALDEFGVNSVSGLLRIEMTDSDGRADGDLEVSPV
jgi:hypothetical protein